MNRRIPRIKAETTSPFARSIRTRSSSSRKGAGRKGTTSGALLAGLVVGVGAVGWIVARADNAHLGPASRHALQQHPAFTPSVLPQDEKTPAKAKTQTAASKASADSGRRPLSFYTQEIRGGLFSEPLPPPPPAPPKPVIVAPPPDPEPSIVPAPVDPFVDWAYDGTIKMGDKVMALLENKKTKEGQYVQIGDSFLGAKVDNVTEQVVSLNSAGKPYTISKTDSITVVPLDKSAAYLSETGGDQQAAQPQAPQPGMNMPQQNFMGGFGGGMFGRGRFQNMNPQQRQMMRNYFRNMRQNRMQMFNMGGG